jgi:hypothetical protein
VNMIETELSRAVREKDYDAMIRLGCTVTGGFKATTMPDVPKEKRPKVFVEAGVSVEHGRLTILVPTETKNEANTREHWSVKARRSKSAKGIIFRVLQPCHGLLTPFVTILANDGPLRVTLTRLGGREMDDDGLSRSQKAVRDAVAYLLLIDDRDQRVHWEYGQETGGASGVRIEIGDFR